MALSAAGLKLDEDGKTQVLLFLGDAEIASFAELIDEHWDELTSSAPSEGKKTKKEAKASAPPEVVKKAKALLDGGKAVDVALFGRMLADLPEVNQDAACQVAHAISTHRVEREFDYFTAVDDQSGPDETGAGMIGQIEFNSATFYRYAVIDAHTLLRNLHGDKDLTLLAVEAFVQAAVRAIPTGKQNTFAAHNPPSFVGTVIRHGGPLNLANAFEKPIAAKQDKSLTTLSVEALTSYESQLATVYADGRDAWGYPRSHWLLAERQGCSARRPCHACCLGKGTSSASTGGVICPHCYCVCKGQCSPGEPPVVSTNATRSLSHRSPVCSVWSVPRSEGTAAKQWTISLRCNGGAGRSRRRADAGLPDRHRRLACHRKS